MLDRGALGMDFFDDGQKGHVKAHDLVLGVVGDPSNLIRVQARIDGVQHPARATDAEIQLEVAITVPGQGGHTVAKGQAQTIQSIGHLARALGDAGPMGAVHIAFHPLGHHLDIAMVLFGEINHG